MEELEALRRSKRGERAAFRVLVEAYGDLAYRTAYLVARDREPGGGHDPGGFSSCLEGAGPV